MMPLIYQILADDSAVTGLLGDSIYRDEAPESQAVPYITFFCIAGEAYNKLDESPDMDSTRVQFDIFAANQDAADAIYRSVRDALEGDGYIVGYRTGRDIETRNYYVSFDMTFKTSR